MNKKVLTLISMAITGSLFLITSCYSVFSGGTGGIVVDAESTSTPKAGISNVSVYAYTSGSDRDSDYNSWVEGTVFSPKSGYYGHTTTAGDGSFTIGKLVWKEDKPDFGRDGDYCSVYLLFYHENYGLTKGSTVIVSDSTSDTVYAELTAVKKTTMLNLTFKDVATDSVTSENVYVKVSVPQATAKNPNAGVKVYEGLISGSGNLAISYPRWTSDANRSASIENAPAVSISYVQSGDEITWKGCYNCDNADANYAFNPSAETGITKTIRNPVYSLTFYGKYSKIRMPLISGQYLGTGDHKADGKIVTLKMESSPGNYDIDCGQVTTGPQVIGTSGTEKHGVFTGLGRGYFWVDEDYEGKISTVNVQVSVAGETPANLTVRSDMESCNVQL